MHGPRHVHHQLGGGALIMGKAVQMFVQAASLDQFHAQEGAAFVLPHVENADDVGMS